jgi:O-acetyl-ADP-ribose deacetylase (regulator of RNase III)
LEVIPGRLNIRRGDISLSKTQAVVNAANTELWMGSGVAGALKERGGDVIEREAMAQAPIKPGGSVMTRGGVLFADYVIHVATMEVGEVATAKNVRLGTMGALALAKDNSIDSIAFPALGTGVGGISLSECARAMLPAISRWLRENELPGIVDVLLFSDEDMDVFLKAWHDLKLEGEL